MIWMLCALMVGAGVVVAPPASAATTYTFLQFNTCGNESACGNRGDAGASVTALRTAILDHSPRRPVAATLNEVCRNQATALDEQLSGYSVYFRQNASTTCANGQPYGDAVVYAGTAVSGGTTGYQLSSPTTSKRAMACVHLASPNIVVCATHLQNGGTAEQVSARRAQAKQVADIAGGLTGTAPTVVGGDFNTTPTADELDVVYRSAYGDGAGGIFNEDSGCCARSGTATRGSKKIDYVFASTRFGLGSCSAVDTPYSDHRMLWASLSL